MGHSLESYFVFILFVFYRNIFCSELLLIPGRRGGATARSALGWHRPSVGVSTGTLGGCRAAEP